MLESLILFDSVINSDYFSKSTIILFLNMIDLFKQKVTKKLLKDYFPNYEGGDDWEKGVEFIKQRFKSLNRAKLPFFSHITCATDTDNIKFVFACIEDTVLRNYLKGVGIL